MNKIKFSVHPLFILLGVALFVLGKGNLFVAWTITLILHEYAHALVARKLGFELKQIRLMPYGAEAGGGVAVVGFFDEVLIALAGPLLNLCIALLFAAIFWLYPAVYFFSLDFVFANLATALINLLPVFPMDGGRVLLALLNLRLKRSRSLKIARIVGIIIGACFLVGFVFLAISSQEVNITIAVLGIFMIFSAINSFKCESYTHLSARHSKTDFIKKKGLKVQNIMVLRDTPLRQVSLFITQNYFYRVSITDENLNELFVLDENQIERLYSKYDLGTPIGAFAPKHLVES